MRSLDQDVCPTEENGQAIDHLLSQPGIAANKPNQSSRHWVRR